MNDIQFHSDLDRLIEILPPKVTNLVNHEALKDVIELVLDIGRLPEIRHASGKIDSLNCQPIEYEDLDC